MALNDKRLTSLLLSVPNQVDFVKTDKTDKFRIIHKFGENLGVGTTIEDIQSNGGIYAWPTSVFKVEVVSTDADDTALGLGGRSVIVEGLKFVGNDLIEDEEEIATDGLTPVVGLIDWFRINRAWVEKSGVYATTSALSHQGDIDIQTEGGGTIHAQIVVNTVDFGQSLIARFSVPSDARASLQGITASADSNKPIRYFIFQRKNSTTTSAPFTAKRIVFNAPPFSTENTLGVKNPKEFAPNTDVWFAAIAATGADNEITIDFELTLKYFDL